MLEKNRRRGLKAAIGTVTLAAAMVAVPVAQANTTLPTYVSKTYQTNGRVSAIVTIGSTTYIGGSFTAVRPAGVTLGGTGTVARSHLAAISNSTGQLLSWSPATDGNVRALAASPDGGTIYVGGEFSSLGGQSRPHLGAVSASSGSLSGFNPKPNVSVLALAATSTRVYFGGTFTTVGGVARSRLAAASPSGTLDTSWKPVANNSVRALRLSPDSTLVYAGGDFTAINGSSTQKYFVKLSPAIAAVYPWTTHPGWPVFSIADTASQVFVGGNGTGGHAEGFTTTGTKQWIVQTDGGVQSVATSYGVVYVGGHFDNVCAGDYTGPTTGFNCPTVKATRHKLLAVSATNAALDPWAPNPNSTLGVWSMATTGSKLDVGGDFTAIGANPRSNQQGFAQFG